MLLTSPADCCASTSTIIWPGATAGVELARRAASAPSGPASDTLNRLATEIAQDREALLSIMAAQNVPVQRLKTYGGWVAEKLGRVKLNGRLTNRSPLSALLELEGPRMAVDGKAAGWETLTTSLEAAHDVAMLNALRARAQQQLATLAELHATTARELFSPATRA